MIGVHSHSKDTQCPFFNVAIFYSFNDVVLIADYITIKGWRMIQTEDVEEGANFPRIPQKEYRKSQKP